MLDNLTEQNAQIYEREVQLYLAENLALLGEPILQLVEVEHAIQFGKDAGRIDILAKDNFGSLVAIEVKRGVAGRGAIGQLQSYMGALVEANPEKNVSGILVAMGLDQAARAALLVTSDIRFFEFKTRFDFQSIKFSKPEVQSRPAEVLAGEFRQDYWERLGGSVSDEVISCSNCGKLARVVFVGATKICGICGKPIFAS